MPALPINANQTEMTPTSHQTKNTAPQLQKSSCLSSRPCDMGGSDRPRGEISSPKRSSTTDFNNTARSSSSDISLSTPTLTPLP